MAKLNKFGNLSNPIDKSPAKSFITPPEQEERRTKSRRANHSFYPDVYEELGKVAKMQETTVNDLLNVLAEKYVKEHTDLIELHDKVFKG